MLKRFLTLSTTCQQILGHNCQLWVPVQISDPLEQVLQQCIGLCDLHLSALYLSRFSFSAICSLFLSDDPSCREQFVVSLSSSPTSVDVEVCSTSIVGVSSSRFLLDGILLFPSSPSLVFVLKNIAD